ncbi:MAG: ABC-F family ATP-binding cassette domain-containing protein [Kiritimatiellia bacterium]
MKYKGQISRRAKSENLSLPVARHSTIILSVIDFQNIVVRYGTQEVLENISLRINARERVGIVGPNGAGKSTLFHLLMGDRLPDKGNVVIEGKPNIGYVRQHLEPAHDDETLLEYALRGMPRLHDLERAIHETEARLAQATEETERARLMRQVGDLQHEFEDLGGYQLETKVKVALGGLGFSPEAFNRAFLAFSGGWQMRAELARVLAAAPDLLLLDEPSNYLDLPAVEWLQRFLRSFDGTLLIISHDRYLLRTLTSITVEVDAGLVTRYPGDLDFYLREREARQNLLVAAKANQDRKREHLERFVERFKAKAAFAAQAQSRVKMLEKMEEIRLPRRSRAAACLRIAPAPHCGAEVVRLEHVDFSYDGQKHVLKAVDLQVGRGEKIAIVGYNGMGKTTLLRILAGTRQPTGGKRILGHKVIPGYQSQEYAETIDPEQTVLSSAKEAANFLTERELRSQLGAFGFGEEDVTKCCGVLSGGERIRLAFLRLFLSVPNFLLLDEPTTHLDIEGCQALERLLQKYDGTVCMVSHDVTFVRAAATSIIEISPTGIRRFPGGYDYYREKVAAEAAAAAKAGSSDRTNRTDRSDPSDQSDRSDAPTTPTTLNSKELRRVRAEMRAKYQTAIKDLRQRVQTVEHRIARLETEQTQLSAELSSGAPDLDYAGKSARLKNIQSELGRHSADWEDAASELDRLQKEMSEAQSAVGA